MRTTVRLTDDLYSKAKAEAERLGIPLSRLVEQGLRLRLRQPKVVVLPTCGNGHPFDHSPEELKRLAQESDWGGGL